MRPDEKDRKSLRPSAVRERLERAERGERSGKEVVRQAETERLEVVVMS